MHHNHLQSTILLAILKYVVYPFSLSLFLILSLSPPPISLFCRLHFLNKYVNSLSLFFSISTYFLILFRFQLYHYYGFRESDIAVLYVAGFAASVVFGTATGPLADLLGRRKIAQLFCVMYTFCW